MSLLSGLRTVVACLAAAGLLAIAGCASNGNVDQPPPPVDQMSRTFVQSPPEPGWEFDEAEVPDGLEIDEFEYDEDAD